MAYSFLHLRKLFNHALCYPHSLYILGTICIPFVVIVMKMDFDPCQPTTSSLSGDNNIDGKQHW